MFVEIEGNYLTGKDAYNANMMNSSKQNYFLKLYRKQNSVKACSMPPFGDLYQHK